jgi:hypothetical protein
MWKFIDFCLWRPATAFFSMLRMAGEDIPAAMKIDAAVSRSVHIFSQPAERRPFHPTRANAGSDKGVSSRCRPAAGSPRETEL